MELVDLTGKRFGGLVVKSSTRVPCGGRMTTAWFCRCDCGNTCTVMAKHLRSGATRSCGCLRSRPSRNRTHGESMSGANTREYRAWLHAKGRCHTPSDKAFRLYGARGIAVCERWRTSYENFLADMGRAPAGGTLERINVDGNYEPGNCRWATRKEQSDNTRRNVLVIGGGRRMTLKNLCDAAGVDYKHVHRWFRRRG